MSVIPAQIQQLPGRDFTYDNNPSAFETILGGVGAFMNSTAEKQKAEAAARNQAMANGFASLFAKGVANYGQNPDPYGKTETWAGVPLYFKDVVGGTADDRKDMASAAKDEASISEEGRTFELTKAFISSAAQNPSLKLQGLDAPNPAAVGGFAYNAAKEAMNNMKTSAQAPAATKKKGGVRASSGSNLVDAVEPMFRVKFPDGVTRNVKKTLLEEAIKAGGTIAK